MLDETIFCIKCGKSGNLTNLSLNLERFTAKINTGVWESVAKFYNSMMGRPVCGICIWNPMEEFGKGGYIDDYPPQIWVEHIKDKHPELLKSKDEVHQV